MWEDEEELEQERWTRRCGRMWERIGNTKSTEFIGFRVGGVTSSQTKLV